MPALARAFPSTGEAVRPSTC